MNDAPPVSTINWPDARRIISTRYPPIDLFEDIADPEDWELIVSAEMKTNPRIAETIGHLNLIPTQRRVGGAGASYVMAPFTHISVDWAGRFHDGTFGAYYAARVFETALAETIYHRAQFYRATAEKAGWLAQFRELVGTINNSFHDIRSAKQYQSCLDPDDYKTSQAFARQILSQDSNGIVYPSVRDPSGECVAAFWPDVIEIPKHGRLLSYHFDGERIDFVRDETTKEVFRVE